jgi:hypothetical protein
MPQLLYERNINWEEILKVQDGCNMWNVHILQAVALHGNISVLSSMPWWYIYVSHNKELVITWPI